MPVSLDINRLASLFNLFASDGVKVERFAFSA